MTIPTDPEVDQMIADAAASATPREQTPEVPAAVRDWVPRSATCDVLLADDAAASRDILTAILRSRAPALRVRAVKSGEEAVQTFTETRARVTLLDIDMPGVDGLEAMERIRAIDPAAFIGIVSGSSSANNVRAALQGGASAFVVKPFTSQRIVDVLRRYEKQSGRALLTES